MKNVATDLLIETNWLGKYKVNIDWKNSIMKIPPENNKYNVCNLEYKKIEKLPLKKYYDNQKVINLHAKNNEIIKPFEQKLIRIKNNYICKRDIPVKA